MKLDIFIYEDQDGKQLYPEGSSYKEEYIKKKFFNNIRLDLNKNGNILEITCFVAARGVSRDERYYIKYIDTYSENYFKEFKICADHVLSKLKIEPRCEDIRNKIFNNIEKFDQTQNINLGKRDILYFKKNGVGLEYSGGNIDNLSTFCNNILQYQFDNVNIVISFNKEYKLGNFNIYNVNYDGEIKPTMDTELKLNKFKQKIIRQQKESIKDEGEKKIKSGIMDLFEAELNDQNIILTVKNIMKSCGLTICPIQETSPRIHNNSLDERIIGGSNAHRTVYKVSGKTYTGNVVINTDDNNLKNRSINSKIRWPIKSIILLLIIVGVIFIGTNFNTLPYFNTIFASNTTSSLNNESDIRLIKIENYQFLKANYQIKSGQKVRWENYDNISYYLLSSEELWDEPYLISKGENKEQQFNNLGIYNFSLYNYSTPIDEEELDTLQIEVKK